MFNELVPAKILLFGEYTLLNGSMAISIPYWKLNGKWSIEAGTSSKIKQSKEHLDFFLKRACSIDLNLEKFKSDLDAGLWFDSSIPQGYGLGSSGAIIAAIYERFGLGHGDTLEERNRLAKLENHFHGSSSGLDPLVSLLKKPLLIHDIDNVQVVNEYLNLDNFFLLDTGTSRQAAPFVKIYQDKMSDRYFRMNCVNILCAHVNLAIKSLIGNDSVALFNHMCHISQFQIENFKEMIPLKVQQTWMRGINSGNYVLKLCGAGGGGFILGFQNPTRPIKLSVLDGFPLTHI